MLDAVLEPESVAVKDVDEIEREPILVPLAVLH